MLIDTHCHLDAAEFNEDCDEVAREAYQSGVGAIVVPAVHRNNFDAVMRLAQKHQHCRYALGIHPMYVNTSSLNDLRILKTYIEQSHAVAVGEIGLDYFETTSNKVLQEYFFVEQLKLAQTLNMPVILHVRRSIDDVLKHLRRYKVVGGIAHAFNGSLQQAEVFISMGFKLGFGGAMTYPRALKIRSLAKRLPLDALVLETDAPDIAPAWLKNGQRNTPLELNKIAQVLANLRSEKIAQVLEITASNAVQVLPKIADLLTPAHVIL